MFLVTDNLTFIGLLFPLRFPYLKDWDPENECDTISYLLFKKKNKKNPKYLQKCKFIDFFFLSYSSHTT